MTVPSYYFFCACVFLFALEIGGTLGQENDTKPAPCTTILEAPNCTVYHTEQTSAIFNCNLTEELDCYQNLSIIVYCNATEGNNTLWGWVISFVSYTQTVDNFSSSVDFTVGGMSPFTNYSCSIFSHDDLGINSSSTIIDITTEQDVPTSPRNITISTTYSTINSTWQEPYKIPSVLTGYWVYVEELDSVCVPDEVLFWGKVIEPHFEFQKLLPNFIYNVTISPSSNYGNGSSESIMARTNASEPPRCTVLYEEQTSVELTCTLIVNLERVDCYKDVSIYILCEALETNNVLWPWVNPNVTHSQSVERLQNDTDVTIQGLSPFTNYTCQVDFSSNLGFSNAAELSINTKPSPPTAPQNVTVLDVTNSSFTVVWQEPDEIPSFLTEYWIYIEELGPSDDSHYVDDECKPNTTTFSDQTTNTTYQFEEAFPDFKYNITVLAGSSAGNGTNVTVNVVTLSSASQPPRNVSDQLIQIPERKNIFMQLNFSWVMPCNTNGPSDYFILRLTGNYTENQTIVYRSYDTSLYKNDTQYYFYIIDDIKPSTEYAGAIFLMGNDQAGIPTVFYFTTPPNYPGSPDSSISNIGHSSFTVSWTEPNNQPGKISNYTVVILSLGPEYERIVNCPYEVGFNHTVNGSVLSYTFSNAYPYFDYSVSVYASTARGDGNHSIIDTFTTLSAAPFNVRNINHDVVDDNITDLQYSALVNITFDPPCFMNGPFLSYNIRYTGLRPGYNNDENNQTFNYTFYDFALKPDYNYTYSITTHNVNYSNLSETKSFLSPSGVPNMKGDIVLPSVEEGLTDATVILNKKNFDSSQGDIKYIALIISSDNVTGGEFESWDGWNWPEPESDVEVYYQTTTKFWYPWTGSDSVKFIFGSDTHCTEDQYCNRPLVKDTQYYVIVKVFTLNFTVNSWPIAFHTDTSDKLALTLGLIFGLLTTAIIGFVGFVLWRKGVIKYSVQTIKEEPSRGVPVNKFVEYCTYLEHNPDVLKAQYTELCEESKQATSGFDQYFALLPENKRKNRYINILPFDHTRVKLMMDEDDEIGSDYINASYIRGHSGSIEYIASQGPLSSTCRDFWKMILQEQVSVIVMVSKFIENNKDKCYKYFPNNHENMQVSDDIEVRCCTELNFGTYCIRSLQVKKDIRQHSVVHMQFLEWPDFGVPSDTENMLQFCHQFQERWAYEGGLSMIHCSAGVGRSGTLIAVDILLRALKAESKTLDVFDTVLELRKQRVNMVQTEKQYMYIYSLLKSIIEDDSIMNEDREEEHFYENINIVKNAVEGNLIGENTAETQL